MEITRSKITALVIAIGYLVTAVVMSGWDTEGVAIMCLMLSLPLAFIWLPDEISAYCSPTTRFGIGRGFNSPTPASMVTLVGWLCLVGYLPLMAYLLAH